MHQKRTDITSTSTTKEIESLITTTGGASITDNSRRSSLTIRSQKYYDGTASTMTDERCVLDDGTAKNIFVRLQQVITCGLCAPSVVGGPQAAVACLLLVCLGSPTALQAVVPESENDCVDLAERAYDCYTEVKEKYGAKVGPVTPLPT
jgi:hypothetical protein